MSSDNSVVLFLCYAFDLSSSSDPEETAVTLHDALIAMVHDPDHYVRMFIARTVPILFLANTRTLQLVSGDCQRETFEKVSGMLQKAHQVLVRDPTVCLFTCL